MRCFRGESAFSSAPQWRTVTINRLMNVSKEALQYVEDVAMTDVFVVSYAIHGLFMLCHEKPVQIVHQASP